MWKAWKRFNLFLVVADALACIFFIWAFWKTTYGLVWIPALGVWSWTIPASGFFLFLYLAISCWEDATAREMPPFLQSEKRWALPYGFGLIAIGCYLVSYHVSDPATSWTFLAMGIGVLALAIWLKTKVPPPPTL